MFTGIIEGVGEITKTAEMGKSSTIDISCPQYFSAAKSDSVAVDGVCLTVRDVKNDGKVITLDISHETLSKTTLGSKRVGDRVNLERAMRADGRFGGHFVTGHVDGTGLISSVRTRGNFKDITIKAGAEILKYIVKKGSVAMDGVSLTVNDIVTDGFMIIAIPFTLENTTLSFSKAGMRVNIEVDIIARYLYEFTERMGRSSHQIDSDFLERHGFK